jgi:hypothetical protein
LKLLYLSLFWLIAYHSCHCAACPYNFCTQYICVSHLTPHTPHLTPHTPHLTPLQGNAMPSWSLSLADALTDQPSHSAASASLPWTITRASLLSSSPSASSSSSGLWVKNCVSQLRALAQPCLPLDLSPLQRLLQLWSCDTG